MLTDGGPEVPVDPSHLTIFRLCFLRILTGEWHKGRITIPNAILSKCDPRPWISGNLERALMSEGTVYHSKTMRFMFVLVHKTVCRPSTLPYDASTDRTSSIGVLVGVVQGASVGERLFENFRPRAGGIHCGPHSPFSSTDSA